MNVEWGGDDLGTCWYVFTKANDVDILNHLIEESATLRACNYKVVDVYKRFRWFKPNEVWVILEKINSDDEKDPDDPWTKLGDSLRKHLSVV